MRPQDITTEGEYWEYCTLYSDKIFVREEVEGKWQSVSLNDLSPQRRAVRIKEMLNRNHIPVRIIDENESE
jgi:hypothetical protein